MILIDKLGHNASASDEVIQAFQEASGIALPQDYIRFLQLKNGGEGFLGRNSYVILWCVDELLALNHSYNVKEYAPGLFFFGSDGGGEAYAFDTRAKMSIVKVPFVGMSLDLVEDIAPNFEEFLEILAQS